MVLLPAVADSVGSLVACLGLPKSAARLRGCVVGLRVCLSVRPPFLLDWKRAILSFTLGPGEADLADSCPLVLICSATLRGDLRTLPVRGGGRIGEVAAARGERVGDRGMAEALMVDSPLLVPAVSFSVESEPESEDFECEAFKLSMEGSADAS